MHDFKCGNSELDCIERYKYLGLWLSEHLDYRITASEVAKSAHRALGVIISKARANGGIPYNVYMTLFYSLVLPIITYGAALWSQRDMPSINAVHNRAARFIIGVGKHTPVAAVHMVHGDTGWTSHLTHQWKAAIRQWCRLHNMNPQRLTKRVYLWSEHLTSRSQRAWITKCKSLLRSNGMVDLLTLTP